MNLELDDTEKPALIELLVDTMEDGRLPLPPRAQMPLPSPGQRWTGLRKAAVVEAVRGGWVPIEEVSRVYMLSVDEFLAWESEIDRVRRWRPAQTGHRPAETAAKLTLRGT